MTPSEQLATWPVERAGFAILRAGQVVERSGDDGVFELASIAKLFAAMTALIAIEERSIDLDDPAGPEGATVRHLLSHSAGYDFDSDRIVAGVGARRVYSNTGIERFTAHLEKRTGMPYGEYLRLGVLEPLGLSKTVLYGSPAQEMRSSVADVAALAAEFMRPRLVSDATMEMARSPVFPDLGGVLPGIGRFDPNPFGLAIEVKGAKSPHWSGSLTSPATFGHFGGSGTFLWVDPSIDVAAVALTNRAFDAWAMRVWPPFGDLVVRHHEPRG
ncbi:MAG TPA: serine hydrolase domain-containing protein [Acidimicrobiia bacterium]|nr:serine hydrolase domain-containing protein [Acidimicrobiia bacterium]